MADQRSHYDTRALNQLINYGESGLDLFRCMVKYLVCDYQERKIRLFFLGHFQAKMLENERNLVILLHRLQNSTKFELHFFFGSSSLPKILKRKKDK